MRRLTRPLALTAAALAVTMSVPVSAASANPQKEKDDVDKRVEELMQEHDDLSEELARVVAELEDAESRLPDAEDAADAAAADLAETQRENEELAARLTSAENAQTELQNQIDDGEEKIAESQGAVVKVARQAYQNSGVTSDVAMLLQMASSDGGAEGLTRVDSAVRSQQRTLTKLTEQRAANVTNQDRLTAVTDEVSDLKDEAAQAVLTKAAAEKVARDAREELDGLITQQTSAKDTIEANRASTAEEIEKQKAEQERLAKEVEDWIRENGDKIGDVGDGTLGHPAPGTRITSPFGWRIHPIAKVRRMHTGTDFGTPCGTDLYASESGVVVSSGYAGGYGNRVVLSHGKIDGKSLSTTYSHNSRNLVRPGQRVERGQVIAKAGTTGSSTGCHLHFEIHQDGTAVNPLNYV